MTSNSRDIQEVLDGVTAILLRYGLRGGWSADVRLLNGGMFDLSLTPITGSQVALWGNTKAALLKKVETWAANRTRKGRDARDGVAQ